MEKDPNKAAVAILRDCKTVDEIVETIAYHAEVFVAMMIISANYTKGGERHINEGMEELRKQAITNFRQFSNFHETGTGHIQ